MSGMTQEMGKSAGAGAKNANANSPKKGDHFRCQECGMELEITTACKCNDPEHVHFQCCGQDMAKV